MTTDQDESIAPIAHGDESTAAATGPSAPSVPSRKLELKRLAKLKKIRKYVPQLRTPKEGNNNSSKREQEGEKEAVVIDVDENSRLLPTAETSSKSIAQYDATELAKSNNNTVRLGRWSTILTSDFTLTAILAAALVVAFYLLLPGQQWKTVSCWVGIFFVGYWTGRRHVPKEIPTSSAEERMSQTKGRIPDHRASMRQRAAWTIPKPEFLLHDHLILSKFWNGKHLQVCSHPFRRHPVSTPSQKEVFVDDESPQFGRLSLFVEQAARVQDHSKSNQLVCTPQGLDIFLTDAAPESVCENPVFLEAGLREKPMFVLNAFTHVGNIIFYFQLPDWVRDWSDSLKVNPNADPPSTIALKRFLGGTDSYRNERFLTAVALVDAPAFVRILAPGDSTTPFTVVGIPNPGTWCKYPASTQDNGRQLAPALELQLDLAGSPAMRTAVGLLKRHLRSLVLDVALLIGGEDENGDPGATVGCFRMDRIEFRHCPEFPHTPQEEVEQAQRASLMFRTSPSSMGDHAAALAVAVASPEINDA